MGHPCAVGVRPPRRAGDKQAAPAVDSPCRGSIVGFRAVNLIRRRTARGRGVTADQLTFAGDGVPATSSRWPPAGSLMPGCLRDEVLDSQNRRLSAAHSPPDNANRRRAAFVGQCNTTAECDALHAARVGLFPMMVSAHRLPNNSRGIDEVATRLGSGCHLDAGVGGGASAGR